MPVTPRHSVSSPDGTDEWDLTVDLGVLAASVETALNRISPAGLVSPYGGSAAPDGWLLCDGSAVSRTARAALFTAIGTTYGAGDGTTTFNIPNLKGRVPVGRDSGQTEFDALGEAGGTKTHTLTGGEIPPVAIVGGEAPARLTSSRANPASEGGAHWHPWFGSGYDGWDNVRIEGGGGAHNNLQPYLVLNYIIKT